MVIHQTPGKAGERPSIVRAATFAVESLERRLLLSIDVPLLPFGRVAPATTAGTARLASPAAAGEPGHAGRAPAAEAAA